MIKRNFNQTGFLRPFSMETELDYIKRCVHNLDMIELFPNHATRFKMAKDAFAAKWENASVTVTKLDGTRFFID